MALINCRECGKQISDMATNCIHCGCPIEKQEEINTTPQEKEPTIKIRTIVSMIIFIITIVYVLTNVFIGNKVQYEEEHSVIGSWKLRDKEFFEIFDDGTFYYYGSSLDFIKINYDDTTYKEFDGKCAIKGKYKVSSNSTNNTEIAFFDVEIIGNTKKYCGLNKLWASIVYGVSDDYTQICENTRGVCVDDYSYKKTNSVTRAIDEYGNFVFY